MNKTVEKINALRAELNKEAENLNKQLVVQLGEVTETIELLKLLGIPANEKEPFTTFVKVHGSGQPSFASPTPKPVVSVKGELAAKILKAVSKGAKSQKEIETSIGKEKIYMKLKSMVEGKSLVRVEDGGSVTYKAA